MPAFPLAFCFPANLAVAFRWHAFRKARIAKTNNLKYYGFKHQTSF